MTYNLDLGNQMRHLIMEVALVEERAMFGGLCFKNVHWSGKRYVYVPIIL